MDWLGRIWWQNTSNRWFRRAPERGNSNTYSWKWIQRLRRQHLWRFRSKLMGGSNWWAEWSWLPVANWRCTRKRQFRKRTRIQSDIRLRNRQFPRRFLTNRLHKTARRAGHSIRSRLRCAWEHRWNSYYDYRSVTASHPKNRSNDLPSVDPVQTDQTKKHLQSFRNDNTAFRRRNIRFNNSTIR